MTLRFQICRHIQIQLMGAGFKIHRVQSGDRGEVHRMAGVLHSDGTPVNDNLWFCYILKSLIDWIPIRLK